MDVRETIERRMSVRAYLPTGVPDGLIRELLTMASRAPSGGNVQPWKVYVVNGSSRDEIVKLARERGPEEPEYPIYPERLWEPYRTNRFKLGEAMYATMGIPREDKEARFRWFARNQEFFGASAGLFCFVDRGMNKPQWSDLGMFLQTFMLLAVDAGLDTCAQESWSLYPRTVSEFCNAPEELMLFCGMAIGYRDDNHPVNTLRSERVPVDEFATWV
ncbi:MAG: nitroreductase [Acidimicrobiales bacterium]|nr:nitroreductase [Acidimicrobiales bacterium]